MPTIHPHFQSLADDEQQLMLTLLKVAADHPQTHYVTARS